MTADIEQLKHRARQRLRSTFAISGFAPDKVFIVDLDGFRPIHEDATNVARFLHITHPGKRIIYRDQDGEWGEMIHNAGTFLGFEFHAEPAHLSKLAKLGCVDSANIAGSENNWTQPHFIVAA
jgi:hypothetical protein